MRKEVKEVKEDFWIKAANCKHENFYPQYYVTIGCITPYCSGDEVHCKDCGVYISTCRCGYNNGMSGWSWKRYKSFEKKKGKR